MIKNKIKNFVFKHILPYIGVVLIKIISSTYRVRYLNPENETNILKNGRVPLYCTLHQRLFAGISLFSSRNPIAIMISMSRDGDNIARIIQMLGWHPVRGSSSRGGKKALDELKKLVSKGYKFGHIVDGPNGPAGIVKPGLIIIAGFSGMPILPVAISYENKWTFNSWDKFMLPKPFSRIIFNFGDEISVGKKINKDEFQKIRSIAEHSLNSLTEKGDLMWSDQDKINEVFSRDSQ